MKQSSSRPVSSGLHFLLVLTVSSLLSSCLSDGQDGLGRFVASSGEGPRVRFDPLTEHTPEVPFPNDIATVLDHTSPTGRRVNVRAFSPTVFERDVREHLDGLDGFGTFAPLSVSFSKPLDLGTLSAENIKLVDLGEEEPFWSSRFVPLDVQHNHNFPVQINTFPFPEAHPFPFAREEQLLFDPGNVEDLDADGHAELLTSYEKATNTVIMRPVIPMRQTTEHLVVLTKGLRGRDGEPVVSPFPYVVHASQKRALEKALPYLAEAGIAMEDIAFAWSFTTQSVTRVLEAVRDGMDGEGALAFLQEHYPPALKEVRTFDIPLFEQDGNPYLLDAKALDPLLQLALAVVPNLEGATLSLSHVDYIVTGSFDTPNFRDTPDGIFDMDLHRGTASVGVEPVTFMLCVPRETEDHHPPFPVVLYCHGNHSVRLEGLATANTFARQGIALMAIDAVGHGPFFDADALLALMLESLTDMGIPEAIAGDLELLLLRVLALLLGTEDPWENPVEGLLSIGLFRELLVEGRAEDLDGDGHIDNGANFWTADTFQTRDIVRQTVIDLMRLHRILLAMAPQNVPEAQDPGEADEKDYQEHLMAGDFNLDGRLDIGGPDNRYFQTGVSLGGIVSSVVLGVESGLEAGVPVVPGGGFSDLILRSDLKDVMRRVYYQALGPVMVGLPTEGGSGTAALRFENNLEKFPAGTLATEPGGSIHAFNLSNGEEKQAAVDANGAFVIGVPADEGDWLRLVSYGANGESLDTLEVASPLKGFGLDRNTPRFRRFLGLSQITLEPGDPINYAPHWFMDPLGGLEPRNVLQLTDPGDMTVPINNQVALALAGGLLGDLRVDLAGALERNEALTARQVRMGLDQPFAPYNFPLYDVDDRDQNNCSQPSVEYPKFTCVGTRPSPGIGLPDYCDLCEPIGPIPPVSTGSGISLVRFPFGKAHEFYGYPRGPEYAIFTTYAQNQAGAFLGLQGRRWDKAWDCMFADDDCEMAQSE